MVIYKAMKKKTKVVFRVYQLLRSLRYNLLYSAFGVVVHCKHKPTCGTYLINQVEEKGLLIGLIRGGARVLRCW